MKNMIRMLVVLLTVTSILQSQSKTVYFATIEGDIDLGLAPYVKRVVAEAEENLADAIVFKINTFGGRVDAATQIKDAILNSKITTIAYIDKRAISAGALIALSCEKIVMVPGASMGASTVVDQAGAKQAEKYQSYMRSEMRATAERNKRRTDIAEAMVDERVVIEGLVDSTQLVTLTSQEACKYGMADTILSSLPEVMDHFGFEDADIIELDVDWAEKVIRFINNPIITSLLIMIGLVGFFTEVKTPGWGFPGTAAVIALTIFFGANYILELASVIEIILFIAGVALLLIEVFVVPGFGVFGIAGIILMVAGLFLGLLADFPLINFELISTAIIQLAGAFVMTALMVLVLSKFLPKTNIWNKLILSTNIATKSGYISSEPKISHLVGLTGKAITDLRPSGTITIDSKRYDVVTAGEYLEKGTEVKIIHVEGSKVVVESTK
ncbi:MAG: nodulation protein NfeD [Bacteroidetes bacterium]|nr:nodulation protein NfeD [Bacteroidota bacterium]MBU1678900.1 nodulation protein NfeD [Bacteroidota bacterium]MBU2505994.1 nodulation protein NfeD [Bacteroidota bacterium]